MLSYVKHKVIGKKVPSKPIATRTMGTYSPAESTKRMQKPKPSNAVTALLTHDRAKLSKVMNRILEPLAKSDGCEPSVR